MKTPATFNHVLIPVISVILCLTATSCDQPKTSNSSAQTNDSASVKKMSTDSNSDMPIHTPKDSTEKIPNPYNSSKK